MDIVSYTPDHYSGYFKVMMALNHLKTEPITHFGLEKNSRMMQDAGYYVNDTCAFIAVENDQVLGAVGLEHKDQKMGLDLQVSPMTFALRYGLAESIELLRLALKLNRPKQPGELYIEAISVSPEARGQGVGTQLLQAVDRYCLAHKFDFLSLLVLGSNHKARTLYESLGFRVVRDIRMNRSNRERYQAECFHYMTKPAQRIRAD